MASNVKQRYWFIDVNRLALVERVTNAITVDTVTSDFQPISESSKVVRLYAVVTIADLAVSDTVIDTFEAIPKRFHEGILGKVIADGYKDPRNFDAEKSVFFQNEFLDSIKKAKVFKRSRYLSTGRVAPQEY